MNPETNKFETLSWSDKCSHHFPYTMCPHGCYSPTPNLVRPDGSDVPKHWPVFEVGETVTIKNYTFRVAHIGEQHILFEPVTQSVQDVTDKLEKIKKAVGG